MNGQLAAREEESVEDVVPDGGQCIADMEQTVSCGKVSVGRKTKNNNEVL